MLDEHFEAQFPKNTREKELAAIAAYVKNGNSCQVVGLPGISRSSILSFLAYNKNIREQYFSEEEKMHFVAIDFSEIRNRPLFDVMKYLFLNLTESLRERGMQEEHTVVGNKFREHLSFKDELVLFQGFKEAIDYLGLEQNINTVFLFNRFEEYVPTVTSEFFNNLRILRNRAKYKFSVVFSLNRPLENALEPSLMADYYEFVAGKIVYVSLHDAAFSTFRVSYIEKIVGKKIAPKVLEEVLALTGGHGKLTKLSVEAILGSDKALESIEAFLLSQKTIKAALKEVWLSLLPAEQADILTEEFEDKDVMAYLEAIGLVKNKKVQIPLLSNFLSSEKHAIASESQKIVYDENTNTIKKGGIILSDLLTSSEFRLLVYMLQNQEKVIEREELITVVWSDMKSTAGITDQAVDQLIFRVRRKIEEDANHPTHLQTIKGRGFKFTS